MGAFRRASDLAEGASVVDLTAEFSRPAANVAWRALAMLDLVAPEPARLMEAVEALDAARGQGPGLPDSNFCSRLRRMTGTGHEHPLVRERP
jgi:hypothetical protein